MQNRPAPKQYRAPKVERFGTISELSAGGSGNRAEPMMMMMMAMAMMQRV